jgi:hypothetical protein
MGLPLNFPHAPNVLAKSAAKRCVGNWEPAKQPTGLISNGYTRSVQHIL